MIPVIYITAAVVLLGLCIFVHELGHLLGGRMVGIKAKVFSMGYGKGFIKKKFGDTTYQITLIPFGGYCQFYGEDPSEERSGKEYEFLSAHPLKRVVTVAMGPLFNLFFGILIFFVMSLIGYSKDTNRIRIPEQLRSGKHISVAYKSGIRTGDVITKIGPREVRSFSDIQASVIFSEGVKLPIIVKRGKKLVSFMVTPELAGGGRYQIGVAPFGSRILIADVVKGGAAENAGLRVMDEIDSVDGVNIRDEKAFVKYINLHSAKKVHLVINRKGSLIKKEVTPRLSTIVKITHLNSKGKKENVFSFTESESLKKLIRKKSLTLNGQPLATFDALLQSIKHNNRKKITLKVEKNEYIGNAVIEKVGLIGIYHTVAPDKIHIEYSLGGALVRSVVEPYEFIVMNLKGMGMLFSGKMNVRENLSGPIRIAKIAGDVAYYKGMAHFILLMAKISIILMVMNLLPIPVVDGSHIVFYLLEAVRGKPLSPKIMERIQTVGVIMLIMLGAFIIINDISMLPIVQRLFN